MKKIKQKAKNKWLWVVAITVMFTAVFTGYFVYNGRSKSQAAPEFSFMDYAGNTQGNGGTFTMRQVESQFQVVCSDTTVKITKCKWQTMQLDKVGIKNSLPDGSYESTTRFVTLIAKAKDEETINISCDVTLDDNSVQHLNMTIKVAAVIDERPLVDVPNVSIDKVFEEDTRNSLIMSYVSVDGLNQTKSNTYIAIKGNATAGIVSGSSIAAHNSLSMMFMDSKDADWQSLDTSVVEIFEENGEKRLYAVGAGKTTIRGTSGKETFEMDVYVKPEIKNEKGTILTNGEKSSANESTLRQNNVTAGAILIASVNGSGNVEGIGNKIDWVIKKEVGTEYKVIKDSYGYEDENYKREANLVYITNTDNQYRIDCMAGAYVVQFYVHGTYEKGGTALSNACGPINLKIIVASTYEDKPNVSINIGGIYDLSEAFNMPISMLNDYFDFPKIGTDKLDDNSGSLIEANNKEWTLTAKDLGTATVTVSKKSNAPASIPGVPDNIRTVKIVLHIVDTYTLNITETRIVVGATIDLYGVIGSGAYAEASQFKWSVGDVSYLDISSDEGRQIKVTAKKATNEPQVVTSKWTDIDGVTRVAVCRIIITGSEGNFKITPASLQLAVGGSEVLKTNLKSEQNLVWMSSDATIVTVEPNTDTKSAVVTATQKTGDVVITAYNPDNRVFSTCRITVISPVTSLKIDKGEAYTVSLGEQYVFLKAVYEPSGASGAEMEWISTDKKIATVDKDGMVTLLKKGVTTIQVKPKYNPNSLMATCILTITDKVMTSITTDVTSLKMIRGETHQTTVKILPEDATEKNVTWTSLDTKVAKVTKDGLITAVGVGSTSVMVTANVAYDTSSNPNKFAQAVINVNVRNKLNSISFESAPIYISAGNSQKISVIFNPENDINKNLTWTVSDTNIIKVSKDGVLTGVAEGIASLNVISQDLGGAGISATVYVTPKPVYATNFVLIPDKKTIHLDEKFTIQKDFSPKGVTETDLTWSSSDDKILTVDEKGQVVPKAVGNAVVTAVYSDAPNGEPISRTCTIEVKPPVVKATDFEASPAKSNIIVGQKFQITTKFTPSDTTNQKVEYQSTDEGVVSVSSKGVVKGVGAGDAIIQCQTDDGGFVGTCAVHVDNAVEFSLSPAKKEIAVGSSFTPSKVVNPSNSVKTATWKSSNAAIAKVSSTGKITGKKVGDCTITAHLKVYNQNAKCKVKVRKLKSSVSLNHTNVRIGVGQTYRLKDKVTTNSTKKAKLSWKTSNGRILSVNSSGKIKGKKVGIAKITVITKDKAHAKAVCNVRVIQRVTRVKLNTDYMVLYVGRSKKLTARYSPSNATIKKVKWTSGSSKIARVTSSGTVRGIGEGNTYITASAQDGSGKKAKCYVKVLEAVPATSIVIAQSDMTVKKGDSAKISFTVLPSDTSDGLKFSSNNKRVATVSNKGVIHAEGTGTAEITILSTSGISSKLNVNVVAMNKYTLNMRQYDSETLMVFGAASKITWYSSNSRVATVSNGLVVGKGKGTTYIYAYVNGCKLACKVTITSVNAK